MNPRTTLHRTTATQRRNPRPAGTCKAPRSATDRANHCDAPARLYPGGLYCDQHAPRPGTAKTVAA